MLSRAADYAVRALVYLAGLDHSMLVAQQEIATAIDAPYTFSGKVLQRLVAAGFVLSRRGKGGGFGLTERGRASSMFDVVVAVDGHPALNDCLSAEGRCHRAAHCAARRVWSTAQSQVIATLRAARIEVLAQETARLAEQGHATCAPPPAEPAPVNWATN